MPQFRSLAPDSTSFQFCADEKTSDKSYNFGHFRRFVFSLLLLLFVIILVLLSFFAQGPPISFTSFILLFILKFMQSSSIGNICIASLCAYVFRFSSCKIRWKFIYMKLSDVYGEWSVRRKGSAKFWVQVRR